MIRRPPRSTPLYSSAASDVYKRQVLMIVTASAMAFAHGSNDVANAIGPMSAIISVASEGAIGAKSAVSPWVLLIGGIAVSYTHLRAHETPEHLVCRLLLEKKKKKKKKQNIQ